MALLDEAPVGDLHLGPVRGAAGWRGDEAEAPPSGAEGVQVEEMTATFGRFVVQPLERGFGVTIGNAFRRVLLSSLRGTAITALKIDGVQHEFSTIPGVTEDVADIILNLKGLRFKA